MKPSFGFELLLLSLGPYLFAADHGPVFGLATPTNPQGGWSFDLGVNGRGGCAVDNPDACRTAGRFSRVVLWTSGILYLIGCFSAYVLGPLLVALDT
jgi:hypothetical protein